MKEGEKFNGMILGSMLVLLVTVSTTPLKIDNAPMLVAKDSLAYKPLGWDSIIMLIGDLDDRGPNPTRKRQLLQRIDVAKESGVDTVLLCFRTSNVEETFSELDSIVKYAADLGLGVIPRIIVNSRRFTELIYTGGITDNILPDYTNQTQLELGVNLLRKVMIHLEDFENIVAYQIEWGHYGESWIDSPFWNTKSSNQSFINYVRGISPSFKDVNTQNFANWVVGDVMYYSTYLPSGDPRRDQSNVALFYWYQEWRNSVTLNITWTFRSVAKGLTDRPIIGFSYTGTNTVSYVYSAQKHLGVAFCDSGCNPKYTPNKNFIKDAYFKGIHLGELDFDSPYFLLSEAKEAIAGMYRKGIIPVIFYPLWSSRLRDSDVPILVNYMQQYRVLSKNPTKSEILLVKGRNDIGFWSFKNVIALGSVGGSCISVDPPGLMAILEKHKLRYDIIDPDVYTPSIGNRYSAVVVFVPRDTVDHDFLRKLEKTNSSVIIMHPSFIIGTPTADNPRYTTSAIFGMWNSLALGGRRIKIAVTGTPPGVDVTFTDGFSDIGRINDYIANYLFSYYDGTFDSVYAVTEWDYPVVARIENMIFFGFDIHVKNETQRSIVESFFVELLKFLGYPQSIGITSVTASTSKTVIGQGLTIYFNTTVSNYGLYKETFNITLCANTTAIQTQEIDLPNGTSTTITFEWNTTDSPPATYEVKVIAEVMKNETDTADNIFVYGQIAVSIPGDINADEKVNIIDIAIAARAFGSRLGEKMFEPNADLNEDGQINIVDIATIAREFGKTI